MVSRKDREWNRKGLIDLDPIVVDISRRVNSLLEIQDLKSKLSRLPSDLPSVMEVKVRIEAYLLCKALSLKELDEAKIAHDLEIQRLAYANQKEWNDLILEIKGIIEIQSKNKNLVQILKEYLDEHKRKGVNDPDLTHPSRFRDIKV